MGSRRPRFSIFHAGTLGVIGLLGWVAVTAMMVSPGHGLVSAEMVLPGAISLGLLGARVAGPVLGRSHSGRVRGRAEPSHIHIPRPGREYFSPFSVWPPEGTKPRRDLRLGPD
jgi:hypothetical protein